MGEGIEIDDPALLWRVQRQQLARTFHVLPSQIDEMDYLDVMDSLEYESAIARAGNANRK